MPLSELQKAIRLMERTAIKIEKMTPTDEELADCVGDVRGVERRLAGMRQRWENLTSEMDRVDDHDRTKRVDPKEKAGAPVAVGQKWELVPTYTTKRSYNTSRLLVDLQKGLADLAGGAEISIAQVMRTATERDVIRLNWQWSNLKAFMKVLGVEMEIGEEEIDPDAVGLDDPHVGEHRYQSGVKRVPLKEGAR